MSDDGPVLVLLAAGLGSRFGGDKQLAGFGPRGELLLEYDLFDAHRAGFGGAVIVVRPETEAAFRERLDAGAGRVLSIEYAHQTEPLGTAHALLCAREFVKRPFAVANADDVYGPASFAALAGALAVSDGGWAMVGFNLKRTLSPSGPVSRAFCEVGSNGRLLGLEEMIGVTGGSALVSMNLWGLRPDVFSALERAFGMHGEGELFLPTVIGAEISAGRAYVTVLRSEDEWIGVTWEQDRAWVRERIAAAVRTGCYPSPLWPRP